MQIAENRNILQKKEYPVVKLIGIPDWPDMYLIGDPEKLYRNILRRFVETTGNID